jgi:hypothetical protein
VLIFYHVGMSFWCAWRNAVEILTSLSLVGGD